MLAVALGLVAWAAWPRAVDAVYVMPAARSITQSISLVGPVERDGQAEVTYRNHGMVTSSTSASATRSRQASTWSASTPPPCA